MKWNAFELISPAIEDSEKRVKPFNTREWIKLTFVSLLSSFGGGGFRSGSGGSGGGSKDGASKAGITANAVSEGAKSAGYGLIGLGVFILAIIGLIISYITSVFSFVYLDALTNRKYSIKKSWAENKNLGRSFFGFKILVGLIGIIVTLLIFAIPLINVINIGVSNYLDNTGFVEGLIDFLPYLIIFALFAIVLSVFLTFVYDFALVDMHLKKIKIKRAIKNVFEKIGSQKTESLVYLIAKLVVGIIMLLIAFMVLIFVVITLVIVGLIIYFTLGFISKVIAIVLIAIICLATILATIVALLPLNIFRAYFILNSYEKLFNKTIKKKV